MKAFKLAAIAAAVALPLQFAQAQEVFDVNSVYVGGGLGSNSLSGFDNAMGYQFFAGIPLAVDLGSVDSAVEIGYMNSGDFKTDVCVTFFGITQCQSVKTDAAGLWATYVASMPINEQVDLIGRIGLDFGDDDGLMYGVGAGYGINEQMDIRGEYVIRDNINSLQVNLAYHL